eukprot:8791577-Alexandrium_andersonii.AAC.1
MENTRKHDHACEFKRTREKTKESRIKQGSARESNIKQGMRTCRTPSHPPTALFSGSNQTEGPVSGRGAGAEFTARAPVSLGPPEKTQSPLAT